MISPFNVRVRPDAEDDVSVVERSAGKDIRRGGRGIGFEGKESAGSSGVDGAGSGGVLAGSAAAAAAAASTGVGAAKDGSDGSDDEILDREDLKKVSQSIVHTNERKLRTSRKPKA